MLNRVDPLRRELQTLEKQAETTRIKGEEINKIINDLEASINRYKEEYALLISEANAIKSDLETVEAKVRQGADTRHLYSCSYIRTYLVFYAATYDLLS